ncbi:MAG TPA: CvpA family protein [Cytophagaceae bacterium]
MADKLFLTPDIILIGLLALGFYQGYKKGLIVELITIFAFIVGIISAFRLLHRGIELLRPYIHSERWIVPAAFVLIFAGVYFGISLFGKRLKSVIHSTPLGKADNAAGGILGLIKMAFSLSVLIWIFKNIGLDNFYRDYVQKSYIYPLLSEFAPALTKYITYIIPFQDIFALVKEQLKTFK